MRDQDPQDRSFQPHQSPAPRSSHHDGPDAGDGDGGADPRGSRRDMLRLLHQRLAQTEQHVHDLVHSRPI